MRFVEQLRIQGKKLVLLGRSAWSKLPCDEHVQSRLAAAQQYQLGRPAEDDIEGLLALLARQRGLQLNGRKLAYLKKHLGSDVPAFEDYLDKLRLRG